VFKPLGREPPGAVLRHPQLEFADPRDQRLVVITRPISLPSRRPLALLGAKRLCHLRFEDLMQRRPSQRPQKLLVFRQKGFDLDLPDLACLLAMVCILAQGSGDCDITRIP
jgi:hypothetical protein